MNRTTIERLKVFLEETKGHDQFMLSQSGTFFEVNIKFTRAELVDLLEAARDAAPIVLEGGPLGRRCAKNLGDDRFCQLTRGHSGPCR